MLPSRLSLRIVLRLCTVIGCILLASISPTFAKRYNFRAGNARFSLVGTFGVEYNDNITSTGTNPISDIILKPGLILNTDWRPSDTNVLEMAVGASYYKYLRNGNLDSSRNFANLDRDSNLKYTLKISSFTITFADKFQLSADPTDAVSVDPNTNTVVTSISTYRRLTNTATLTVQHQQKNFTYFGGISRTDVIPFQDEFRFTRRVEYSEFLGINYIKNPAFVPGFRMGLSQNQYLKNFQNDSTGFSFGPTLQWRITPLVQLAAEATFSRTRFKSNGNNADDSQSKAMNIRVGLRHKVNRRFNHSLTLAQNTSFGFISNTTTVRQIQYDFSWRCMKRITYNGMFIFEKGKDSGGLQADDYKRYTTSLKFEYAINKYTKSNFEIFHSRRTSRFASQSYPNTRFVVGLNYEF